jgi:phosphoserine phosphatase
MEGSRFLSITGAFPVLIGSQPTSSARLSKAEFFRLALERPPAVAVFDCDGTLWSGDAGYGFMVWTLEQGLVSPQAREWLDARYRLYGISEVSEAEMCGDMVKVYAGLYEEEIRTAAAEYFRENIHVHVFHEMRELIARLRGTGSDIWAVSSTNNWVIEEGVREFGIQPERILAARVAIREAIITDEILDVPTDEGKAEALRRVGISEPDVVFGNSIHDAAMLEIARRAFPVNPSPGLLEFAAQHGWAVYYPESLTEA